MFSVHPEGLSGLEKEEKEREREMAVGEKNTRGKQPGMKY